MDSKYFIKIAKKLNIEEYQVSNTVGLLEYGATIPFISRYRKEQTGSLDEVQIEDIQKEMLKYEELEDRRASIIKILREKEKLTPILLSKLEQAETLTELEDIYLPYKEKKKTRATKAREKGLGPLADKILQQKLIDIDAIAKSFINSEVPDIASALQGARDIIAETANENPEVRQKIRKIYDRSAVLSTQISADKEKEGRKYKDYFNWSEDLRKMPSHRVLAILRAEKEKILKVEVVVDQEEALAAMNKTFVKNSSESSEQIKIALEDSYSRLLQPSIENEYKKIAKEKADEAAIKVFVANLSNLLLSPPLGKHRVLAIDPGFRTGCKIVTLDEQANLLFNATIYPFSKDRDDLLKAIKTVSNMVEQYKIDIIAIGNGTASGETERFIKKIRFKKDINVYIVDESGASIYSASAIAREEFPEYDVTVRGAVSIGRRLIDPLSELVKIDPKSIGVGQYQHDVDRKKLHLSLENTVKSCVNSVGVDVNTASKYLLTHVSGLGNKLAENVVTYRKEQGRINSRKELKKVKLMGNKAFEQSAGFLRIIDGSNPLDASAVHPESYTVVEKMASDLGVSVSSLITNKSIQKNIDIKKYINKTIGEQTLIDILEELAKPGRDPRAKFESVSFSEKIQTINDLKEGMKLKGIVKNVTNFGAFVDIGIKTNGLIHISEMADGYVKDPTKIVKVHQIVNVVVSKIDIERNRIGLSMKN